MALSISCLTEMLDCLPKNFFVLTNALNDIISTEIRPLGDSVLIQTLYSALYTQLLETSEKDAASRSGETVAISKSSICLALSEAIVCIDEDNKHTESIRNLITRAQEKIGMDGQSDQEHGADDFGDNLATCNAEFDVDTCDFASDLICGDLLTTSVGKQSVKVS